MHLGDKIRFLRGLKGLSQENMADSLQMSITGYAKIEQGKTDIPFSRLQEIANVLEIKPEDIITFNEKMIFKDCTNVMQGYNHSQYINDFEKERQAYLSHIQSLEKQIIIQQQIIEKLLK